jgi:hypothetical protein
MKLLAAEFDIVIPGPPPIDYWPWVGGIVAVAIFACMWWVVSRAVRKAPILRDHVDDCVDPG